MSDTTSRKLKYRSDTRSATLSHMQKQLPHFTNQRIHDCACQWEYMRRDWVYVEERLDFVKTGNEKKIIILLALNRHQNTQLLIDRGTWCSRIQLCVHRCTWWNCSGDWVHPGKWRRNSMCEWGRETKPEEWCPVFAAGSLPQQTNERTRKTSESIRCLCLFVCVDYYGCLITISQMFTSESSISWQWRMVPSHLVALYAFTLASHNEPDWHW